MVAGQEKVRVLSKMKATVQRFSDKILRVLWLTKNIYSYQTNSNAESTIIENHVEHHVEHAYVLF